MFQVGGVGKNLKKQTTLPSYDKILTTKTLKTVFKLFLNELRKIWDAFAKPTPPKFCPLQSDS